jgi:hypothetical protein
MTDHIQKYRPSPLSKVKQYLARRETTYITLPGHSFPIAVSVPRRRQWPLLCGMVGVALGAAFVMTRLLTATPAVPVPSRPPTVAGCRTEPVRMVFSHIKDRVRVYLNGIFFRELKHGEIINADGSIERTMRGAGWGHLDVPLHPGPHTFRFVAINDKGPNAGAVVDVRHATTKLNVFARRYGLHDQLGVFGDRTVHIDVPECHEEQRHERTTSTDR